MSKKEKQLKRFQEVPKDLTWNEFVSVLGWLGFECHRNSGSSRAFYNSELNVTMFFHEPHPSSIVKVCYIKYAIAKLREHGLLS